MYHERPQITVAAQERGGAYAEPANENGLAARGHACRTERLGRAYVLDSPYRMGLM
jgi:hypothetical protein